jgi:quercetin dioxygenase-like cupin family protein
MMDETHFHQGTTVVRRLRLAPGEAMPWHRDPFHRVAVVLSGDLLSIE